MLVNLYTVVYDTLHAEPQNSVHSKKVAEGMDEIIKLIEEKSILVDTEEDIFHKNGLPAMNLYSDRTHTYIQPFGRCWLDWWQNRQRYVRRLGCAPWRTGLLPTYADGQVCWEVWAEQTLPDDKTVKNLIWLLSHVPPHSEFQLGRARAVFGRIHRKLKLGHLSIDDDAEGWGDDDGGNSR